MHLKKSVNFHFKTYYPLAIPAPMGDNVANYWRIVYKIRFPYKLLDCALLLSNKARIKSFYLSMINLPTSV